MPGYPLHRRCQAPPCLPITWQPPNPLWVQVGREPRQKSNDQFPSLIHSLPRLLGLCGLPWLGFPLLWPALLIASAFASFKGCDRLISVRTHSNPVKRHLILYTWWKGWGSEGWYLLLKAWRLLLRCVLIATSLSRPLHSEVRMVCFIWWFLGDSLEHHTHGRAVMGEVQSSGLKRNRQLYERAKVYNERSKTQVARCSDRGSLGGHLLCAWGLTSARSWLIFITVPWRDLSWSLAMVSSAVAILSEAATAFFSFFSSLSKPKTCAWDLASSSFFWDKKKRKSWRDDSFGSNELRCNPHEGRDSVHIPHA